MIIYVKKVKEAAKQETKAEENIKTDIKSDKKEKTNNFKIIIIVVTGIILLAVIAILVWLFNRTYPVVFDCNNGIKEEILYVKRNNTLPKVTLKCSSIDSFTGWYELIGKTKDGEILSEKPFDFNTKIKKLTILKAIHNEEVKKEMITIKFDSRDGSNVDSLTIEKGSSLVLPKNPTKKGYTFGHWETEGEIPITDGANLSESITLYAVWTQNSTSSATNTTTKTYYCETGYTLNEKNVIKLK